MSFRISPHYLELTYRRLMLRATGTLLLGSLNIIIGWRCCHIVSGVAAPSSSASPRGRHLHRLGSHELDGKRCFVVVGCAFFERDGRNVVRTSNSYFWVNKLIVKIVQNVGIDAVASLCSNTSCLSLTRNMS